MEDKRLVLQFVRRYVDCVHGLDQWLKMPKKSRWEIVESAIRHQLSLATLAV